MNAATTRRPSLAKTLNVRAAAALPIASRPTPRPSAAAITAASGKTWRSPVPSRMTSGSSASTGARSSGWSARMSVTGQASTRRSGARMKLAVSRRSFTTALAPSAPRSRNSWSGCSRFSCMEGVGRAGQAGGPSRRRSGAGQDDLTLVLARAVQDGRVADALHQGGAGALGDVVDHGVARVAIPGGDLHLDQLVVLQGEVDLRDQRVGDALATHLQHRLQVVRLPAQETGLGGGEGTGHAVSTGSQTGTQGIMDAPVSRPSPPWLPAAKAAIAGSRNTSPTPT